MFDTGIVRIIECYSQSHVRNHIRDIFSFFCNMKVCCVFSLESPHRGDFNEKTHNIPFFNILKKINLNYPKSASMGFYSGTPERVRNSRGKLTINVRATEVLL